MCLGCWIKGPICVLSWLWKVQNIVQVQTTDLLVSLLLLPQSSPALLLPFQLRNHVIILDSSFSHLKSNPSENLVYLQIIFKIHSPEFNYISITVILVQGTIISHLDSCHCLLTMLTASKILYPIYENAKEEKCSNILKQY